MKSLLAIFTLVFSVMFSSISFAEWTPVGNNVNGTIYYMDFERIRKHDGYVYLWTVSDFSKPDVNGHLSYQSYAQGDCGAFQINACDFSLIPNLGGEVNMKYLFHVNGIILFPIHHRNFS